MLERASDLAPPLPFLKRKEMNHVVFYSLLQGYRISLLKHSAIEEISAERFNDWRSRRYFLQHRAVCPT